MTVFNQITNESWTNVLKENNLFDDVSFIFQYYEENLKRTETKNEAFRERTKLFFSLLEKVFRNVLIYPYIPAYHRIDKNSGLYQYSLTDDTSKLFEKFCFNEEKPGSLSYTQNNPKKTIVFALTCAILWHSLTTNHTITDK